MHIFFYFFYFFLFNFDLLSCQNHLYVENCFYVTLHDIILLSEQLRSERLSSERSHRLSSTQQKKKKTNKHKELQLLRKHLEKSDVLHKPAQ